MTAPATAYASSYVGVDFNPPYRFGHWEFSNAEINQICRLTEAWSFGFGTDTPINRKKYEVKVLEWATSMGLAEWRVAPENRNARDRLYYTRGSKFDTIRGMPAEALFRMVLPMFEGKRQAGYNVRSHKDWPKLNIYREGSYGYSAAFENEQMLIFRRLHLDGYLWFAYSGDVWQIRIEEPLADKLGLAALGM